VVVVVVPDDDVVASATQFTVKPLPSGVRFAGDAPAV